MMTDCSMESPFKPNSHFRYNRPMSGITDDTFGFDVKHFGLVAVLTPPVDLITSDINLHGAVRNILYGSDSETLALDVTQLRPGARMDYASRFRKINVPSNRTLVVVGLPDEEIRALLGPYADLDRVKQSYDPLPPFANNVLDILTI